MSIQALTREEALRALASRESGLTAAEARRRLEEYGPNEIREVGRTPLWRRFLAQFTHFLAVLLWLAAGLCFLSHYLQPEEGLGRLGWAIVGVILINALFSFLQEYRAERAVAALKALLPFNVTVRREGAPMTIPAREVVPGDILLLAAGDKVPADARVLTATRLMVNNAPLTGESAPQARNAEPFEGEYLESPNLVFAGTLVVSGKGEALALATGMATEFGRIAHLTARVEPEPSPLTREITRLTRVVALLAAVLGVVFFALGWLIGRSLWQNFLFAIGIIVANVPEGLLPTVTMSLAVSSQRLARRNALVKDLTAVEALGAVEVICTDKTGTLTENRLQVQELWVPGGPREGRQFGMQMLLTIAGLCTNAVFAGGEYRGDPTEVALLRAAREMQALQSAERLAEVPFDAERKRMSTVHRLNGEVLVLTKGAVETVLPRCREGVWGQSRVDLSPARIREIQRACDQLMDRGFRVMAFAFRPLSPAEQVALPPDEVLESGLVFVGLIGLADPVRPEVPPAVATCRAAGIRVIMVTGDGGRTALAVARQIGLARETTRVVTGPELEAMSDEELQALLAQGEPVFARLTPRQKLRIVTVLQELGLRVAVTGDGVNDAPALRQAHIGVAMGRVGTDVAREAADLILLDDNFATIVRAVEEGRAVFDNLRKFSSYIFASNIPEIVPYVAFVLWRIPLPLTLMQILAVDLGTDMVPALALGAERASPEVMRHPPRNPREPLLTWPLLARAYLFLGPLEAAAGLAAYFAVLCSGGWQWGMELPADSPLYRSATSACLAGIIVTQVANVFACRSFRESVLTLGFFSNPYIFLGIATELLLAAGIIYHPLGQELFGTAALPAWVWLFLVPFGVALLLLEELRKLAVRRLGR